MGIAERGHLVGPIQIYTPALVVGGNSLAIYRSRTAVPTMDDGRRNEYNTSVSKPMALGVLEALGTSPSHRKTIQVSSVSPRHEWGVGWLWVLVDDFCRRQETGAGTNGGCDSTQCRELSNLYVYAAHAR